MAESGQKKARAGKWLDAAMEKKLVCGWRNGMK